MFCRRDCVIVDWTNMFGLCFFCTVNIDDSFISLESLGAAADELRLNEAGAFSSSILLFSFSEAISDGRPPDSQPFLGILYS